MFDDEQGNVWFDVKWDGFLEVENSREPFVDFCSQVPKMVFAFLETVYDDQKTLVNRLVKKYKREITRIAKKHKLELPGYQFYQEGIASRR